MERVFGILVLGGILLTVGCERATDQAAGALRDRGQQARIVLARSQIAGIAVALDLFRLDAGRYPTSSEGLAALVTTPPQMDFWGGPYLQAEDLSDPWGRTYVYRFPGEGGPYDLQSLGADGEVGGTGPDADLAVERQMPKGG